MLGLQKIKVNWKTGAGLGILAGVYTLWKPIAIGAAAGAVLGGAIGYAHKKAYGS